MAIYTVLRHPVTAKLDAVRSGFSILIVLLNIFYLGWLWAFVCRAWGFGFRLLGITAALFALVLYAKVGTSIFAMVIVLFWIAFSISLGGIANSQVRYSLLRRGFVVVLDKVDALNSDAAISTAVRRPSSSRA